MNDRGLVALVYQYVPCWEDCEYRLLRREGLDVLACRVGDGEEVSISMSSAWPWLLLAMLRLRLV